jgi:hypothetical protein
LFSIANARSLEVGILNIEGVELLELTMQGFACQTTYLTSNSGSMSPQKKKLLLISKVP